MRFCADFDLELLVVENALAIPLNLPLGLALTELIAETGIPVIAHHHDLAWERQRFTLNTVPTSSPRHSRRSCHLCATSSSTPSRPSSSLGARG